MSHNTAIIIQARLGSTRLPKKIMLPFQETTILQYIINKLTVLNLPIIVATTTSEKDQPLVDYLKEKNIKYAVGSEQDVLSRYIQAAEQYNVDNIIRVTSDNPFININYIEKLLTLFNKNINADYWSLSINNTPTVLTHYGIFAELVSLKALKDLHTNSTEPSHKEHVTYGVYTNPSLYNIVLQDITEEMHPYANIRLTVDTPEDYEIVKDLEQHFHNFDTISFNQLGDYINSNPAILDRMSSIIEQNKK